MKFSIKDFFIKCNQFSADLATFTEEILNGKPHFLWRFSTFLCIGIIYIEKISLFEFLQEKDVQMLALD